MKPPATMGPISLLKEKHRIGDSIRLWCSQVGHAEVAVTDSCGT